MVWVDGHNWQSRKNSVDASEIIFQDREQCAERLQLAGCNDNFILFLLFVLSRCLNYMIILVFIYKEASHALCVNALILLN